MRVRGKTVKKILIMAGGTGGHVIPALTVAEALRGRGAEVEWLGTPRGLENELVPKANFPLHHISISGWRGSAVTKWAVAPFLLARAYLQAKRIIKLVNPDVVLGMGGFASGPGGLAARACHKTLIIQEQNAVPGLTNRVLARFADQVFEAFPGSFPLKRAAITTGNPVRASIAQLPSPRERLLRREDKIRLLILGGSQGAQALNEAVPKALAMLASEERPQVWHQTGKHNYNETRRSYQVLSLQAQIDPFIDNMDKAYAWADLVVCRAGALTLTELMAAGLGSLLIPYPYAADDHQTRNAEYLVKAQAAVILPQKQLTPARLTEVLHQLINNRERLLLMADFAHRLYHSDATEKIVQACLASGQNSACERVNDF